VRQVGRQVSKDDGYGSRLCCTPRGTALMAVSRSRRKRSSARHSTAQHNGRWIRLVWAGSLTYRLRWYGNETSHNPSHGGAGAHCKYTLPITRALIHSCMHASSILICLTVPDARLFPRTITSVTLPCTLSVVSIDARVLVAAILIHTVEGGSCTDGKFQVHIGTTNAPSYSVVHVHCLLDFSWGLS
jgi:hypothetical protein